MVASASAIDVHDLGARRGHVLSTKAQELLAVVRNDDANAVPDTAEDDERLRRTVRRPPGHGDPPRPAVA